MTTPTQTLPAPSDAYDMIDRFMRNNLHDDDYAEYSAALDTIYIAAQPAPAPDAVPPSKETLTDLIAGMLGDTYHCTRVWQAWGVGTMSEDDFEPVDESNTPAEIADAVLALYAGAAPVAKVAEVTTGEVPARMSEADEARLNVALGGVFGWKDAAHPQHPAPQPLTDALGFIARFAVRAVKTNSRDTADWLEDMAYIGEFARNAVHGITLAATPAPTPEAP